MEDAGTSEEDDINSQDSNTPTDHGHLARNCSIKIITLAVKPLVISKKGDIENQTKNEEVTERMIGSSGLQVSVART